MKKLLSKQENKEEIAEVQQCMQQEPVLEAASRLSDDESLPEIKDSCDHEKFQWFDHVLLNGEVVNGYKNSTCHKSGEYGGI